MVYNNQSISVKHQFLQDYILQKPLIPYGQVLKYLEIPFLSDDFFRCCPDLALRAMNSQISPYLIAAAAKFNRAEAVMNTYEECRRLGKIDYPQFHKSILNALGIPTYEMYEDTLAFVCVAILLGYTHLELMRALAHPRFREFMHYLEHPEYLLTQKQSEAIGKENVMRAIYDHVIYEVPLALVLQKDYFRIRDFFLYCCESKIPTEVILTLFSSDPKLAFLVESAKKDELPFADVLEMIGSGALQTYQMLRSRLQYDRESKAFYTSKEMSSLTPSALVQLIKQANLVKRLNFFETISDQYNRLALVSKDAKGISEIYYIEEPKICGKGDHGTVFKVLDILRGKFFALKCPRVFENEPELTCVNVGIVESESNKIRDIYERAIKEGLISSHDDKLMGLPPSPPKVFTSANSSCMGFLTDLVDRDLKRLVKDEELVQKVFFKDGRIKLDQFLSICLTLYETLKILHRLGYAHRDIHEKNIGYSINQDGLEVGFIDFGASEKIREDITIRQDVVLLSTMLINLLKKIEGTCFFYPNKSESLRLQELKNILNASSRVNPFSFPKTEEIIGKLRQFSTAIQNDAMKDIEFS